MLTTNQPMLPLGNVKVTQHRNFKYTLKNEGSQSLRIENLTVGCGSCTVASMSQSVIEAGGTAELNVVFTPTSTGQQIKSVTVHYVSGNQSNTLIVKFSANVTG